MGIPPREVIKRLIELNNQENGGGDGGEHENDDGGEDDEDDYGMEDEEMELLQQQTHGGHLSMEEQRQE